MIEVLELFGGLGAGKEAMRGNPNFNFSGYIDNDKHATEAYNFIHHSAHRPYDIRDFTGKKHSYDGIIAGFPCQDVSQAGKQDVQGGKRTILYLEMLRVIAEIMPKWFILENVKGLLYKKHIIHYQKIITTLKDLGYSVTNTIQTPLDFGIPQSRPRIFIVGRKEKVDWVNFKARISQAQIPCPPLKTFLDKDTEDQQWETAKIWKTHTNFWVHPRKKDNQLINNNYNVTVMPKPQKVEVTNSGFRAVHKPDKIMGAITTRNGRNKVGKIIEKVLKETSIGGYQVADIEKHTPTLTGSCFMKVGQIKEQKLHYRKITINECCRLMGWERVIDYFNTLTYSRAKILLGNAIVPKVLKVIIENLTIFEKVL